ncbi:aminoacylase [Oceanicoccus sagamiensis]|uniref:Aminoacylase n=1 Tax=Oceanicoccus sagamiensis TaxID=716816 RepID=A0A1X9N9D6_9GAMM|nr:aminoacylase [Oceanicoccus sagamiensis]ARN74276.1 aminoacylase [Oceanicoccus sagamiensis]
MKQFLRSLMVSLTLVSTTACTADYDIVLTNGRVMDPETQFDAVRNVGIKDGLIAIITEEAISGEQVIDATDHVVAPGFIDTHTHGSDKFTIKMSMMDGVTTGLDLELGAMNVGAWYQREAGQWPMNYGQVVSQEMARMMVHDKLDITKPVDTKDVFPLRAQALEDGVSGWSVSVSNRDQINQISKILDENLRQGALGVGSTIGYASKGISTYEMFDAQRVAARYGRLSAVHTRFHGSPLTPTESQLAFAEVYTNASVLEASLLVCHDNDTGWWEIEEKLALARKLGMNMWGEYYPYTAGSSSIGSDFLVPEMLEGTLGLKYKEVLYDPSQDKFLDKNEYLQIAKDDPGRIIVVYNPPRKEWLPQWLRVPHMVVASDSMWSENPDFGWDTDPALFSGHPRTSGTHSTVLQLAREEGVELMFTLSQLSYWSALHLGDAGIESMQKRGRLQEGMVADIVIFNPKTVAPQSTYKAGTNGLPPIGIPHVIVNGEFVKKDNSATGSLPGLPIRYKEEEKGRFKPIENSAVK